MTYDQKERMGAIKHELAELARRRRDLITRQLALQVELASFERFKLIESAKSKRRRTCLVLELHVSGLTLEQVAQRVGMSVHTVTGYIYQSEGSYSYQGPNRPDGAGRATFWREHKLFMTLRNLQCAVVAIRLGGKLEDIKEVPDERDTSA